MRPSHTAIFHAHSVDAHGFTVDTIPDAKQLKWASYIPPTARVKSTMKASFNANGQLVAGNESFPSAGAFEAELGGLKGYIRGRVLPYPPLKQDFESATLTETNAVDGALFA